MTSIRNPRSDSWCAFRFVQRGVGYSLGALFGGGSRRFSGRWSGGRQAFYICDQLQQAIFADLSLEHGHDVTLVTFDDLRVRIEDRFADVSLVGEYGTAVVEHNRFAEHIQERRAAALAIGDVARHAAILLK